MVLFCWFESPSLKGPFSANCLILQDETHCCALEQIQCNETPGCKLRLSGEIQSNNKKGILNEGLAISGGVGKPRGEIFCFFKTSPGILKMKEKGKPTIKCPITFNMR